MRQNASTGYAAHQETSADSSATFVLMVLAASVMGFQVGHFAEHAAQFAVWLTGGFKWVASTFCGPDTPFMSVFAVGLVSVIGNFFFPAADAARKALMGVEILHLIGNSVFLIGIALVRYAVPTRLVRIAFRIEAWHLGEHVLLTLSSYYFGKPMGVSTLFGYAPTLLGKEWAVGLRVSFHFVMNLAPLPFVMTAIMPYWLQKTVAARS